MNQSIWIKAGVLAALLGSFGAEARAQDPASSQPKPAVGDTVLLTLAEAQRLALNQNPAFLAERQESEIARGQLGQARIYRFNPDLEFEAPGASAGVASEWEARLWQEVEWAGQRGLRIRAAESGLERAESAVRNAARQTLANVSTAFYAALSAQRRLEVVRELSRLNQQLLEVTRIQEREGEISSMDANLAVIEAGRARARVLAAQREATTARLELQRLVGIPPEQTVRPSNEVPEAPEPGRLNQDSLIRIALARRPDLQSQTRAVEQAEALTRLARREAIPNVRLGVVVQREERAVVRQLPGDAVSGDESTRFGVAVSLPVPVFNRNQGVVAEREAQAEQARLSRAANELAVQTQVADAYRAYVAAIEEARVYERDVLEPARSNQALLETAFRAGRISLPTLLLVRNQLLDTELGYWDAWLAERRTLVALEAASATWNIDLNLNPSGNR